MGVCSEFNDFFYINKCVLPAGVTFFLGDTQSMACSAAKTSPVNPKNKECAAFLKRVGAKQKYAATNSHQVPALG